MFRPDSFGEIIERAKKERWTCLLATPNANYARRRIEHRWPSNRVAILSQRVSTADLTALEQLSELKMLDLGYNRLGGTSAVHIARLRNLTTLNLWNNSLGVAGIAHFSELDNLKTLDLRNNSLGDAGASQLSALTNLSALYLSSNDLGKVGAASLSHLVNLRTLDLWDNNLGDDGVSRLSDLKNLTTLYLGYNGLGDSGAERLAGLSNLKTLDISNNNLSHVAAEHLSKLVGLSVLNLWNNNIGDLGAGHLSKLSKLTTLDLRDNGLGNSGAVHLAHLKKLKTLHLGSNSIGSIGTKHISGLTDLNALGLGSNEIGDAGAKHLSDLRNLKVLELGSNGIGNDGAAHLSRLAKLESLDLWNNNLSDAGAASLSELLNLVRVDLGNNDLTEVGVTYLARLAKLTSLDLEDNKLRLLPEELAKLSHLKTLFLNGNAIEGLPPEMQLSKGRPRADAPTAQQILDYYYRLREQKEQGHARPLNEAKILVVGEPGVGKTDLAHWLINNEPHPDPKTTEGIQIGRWMPDGEDGVTINVWDFGGQEIMRATHQFFLTERSLYLLVLDSRQSEEQSKVRSWLERIRNFGKDSPVLVVLNKADQWESSLNRAQLRKDYPQNIGKATFFETACRDGRRVKAGDGVEVLREHILRCIRDLDGVREPMPPEFHAAKAAVQTEARAKSKLLRQRFDQICVEHGIEDAGQCDLLLFFLKNLGALFHYHSHPAEGAKARTFVLDPEWLTAGVYTILTNPELGLREGLLDQRDLPTIFDREKMIRARTYSHEDREFILDMMEGEPFELCYPLPDEPSKRWLVPQLLETDTPDHDIERKTGIAIRYEYRQLPVGLVPRLAVRNHTELECVWRYGLILKVAGSRVLVSSVPEKNYVDVITENRSDAARQALAVARYELEKVHNAMKLEGVDAWLTPPHDPDGRASLAKLYRWRDASTKGREYEFEPQGAVRDYTVGELLDFLEKGATTPTSESDWREGIADLQRLVTEGHRAEAERHKEIRRAQIEMKVQNEQILDQGQTHRDAIVRLLLDEAKNGPRLFGFEPLEPGFFDRPKLFATKFRVTLWCEHSFMPLPVLNDAGDTSGVYEFTLTRDWLVKSAPFLKLLVGAMQITIPVVSGAAQLALPESAKDQITFNERLLSAVLKGSKQTGAWLARSDGPSKVQKGDQVVGLQGWALRDLHDRLRKKDANFGGLKPVFNAKDEMLWVHPRFENKYKAIR